MKELMFSTMPRMGTFELAEHGKRLAHIEERHVLGRRHQ